MNMRQETIYDLSELHRGKCKTCGDNTMIADNGKCPDCIEADKFYEMTTKDAYDAEAHSGMYPGF